MANTDSTLTGLARILSSQPLPTCPMFRDGNPNRFAKEIERYHRELTEWMRNLSGKFTAENIIQTIITGGAGAFDKAVNKTLYYYGDDTPITYDLDTTIDWRQYAFLLHARMADTLAHLQTEVDDPDVVHILTAGTNATYPFQPTSIPSGSSPLSGQIQIDGSGHLQVQIFNGSGVHQQGYVSVFAGAFGKVQTTIVPVGNGV